MHRVEVESFIKSFLLFSISMGLLIATLFYLNYTKEAQTLDETLFSEMRVCSYDLKCEQFVIDFVPKESQRFYTLYKEHDGISSYYPIPDSNDFVMKISLDAPQYEQLLDTLKREGYLQFLGTLVITFILSVLFSLYALSPLRNALALTQEFIKDILHDFNTPLGALRLNSAMLKREIGENKKLERIEQSVQNVLDLQENLRAYLHDHEQQKETFSLKEIVEERVALIEKSFGEIRFFIAIDATKLHTNRPAFKRILDNLVSNAAKYNRPNGSVTLSYDPVNATLKIADTGKGIQNPKRIFERFYKEQERGIGIGLHIVKKLCDELGIKITVESQVAKGTAFTLSLQHLIIR